jgi:antitoxin component YwqK of YwqJK toxin-antitoxin module
VQGYGKLCYADKAGLVEYDGYFRASEFHGVGKHYHHNGKVKYEGEFKDGCRNGKGKLYDNKGGLILKGVFNSTNKD